MNISFLSGTRADYSKIKPYISYLLEKQKDKKIYLFVTGMHMLKKYGQTCQEVEKDFKSTCQIILDKDFSEQNTSQEMAHIIACYDQHLRKDHIDFVFVHGDRPEALAGAIAARLNNIPVCQIEAGDLSGSIDDSIRHSITKLAHRFLVSDEQAKQILLQMGENKKDIFVIGNSSLANDIPDMEGIFQKYDIPFNKYAILIYHPVTTLPAEKIQTEIHLLMKKLVESNLNYIVILPNNDLNHKIILNEYRQLEGNKNFRFFTSLPLDVFINLLKKAQFLIGNSSCGIKEAPYYQVPTIDIGVRQQNRYQNLNTRYFTHLGSLKKLNKLINKICSKKETKKKTDFKKLFVKKLDRCFSNSFWHPNIQKGSSFLLKKLRINRIFRTLLSVGGFLAFFALSSYLFFRIVYTPPIAHIYIDLASVPSLLQMTDALQQPSEEPKLFIWKRFPALKADDRILQSMNAIMVDSKFLGEKNYEKFNTLVDTNLMEFYAKNFNHHFVIHLNAYHALNKSGHFSNIIPTEKIKEIHLYDDAIGRSLWDKKTYISYATLSGNLKTYMHLAQYDPKILPVEKEKIIPLDFYQAAATLSDDKKAMLAHLTGLDLEKMNQAFEHRPVAVFLDDPDLKWQATEKFIKELIRKHPEIKNYTWLYKNHPRVSKNGETLKLLSKYFPKIIVISNEIPLETLIMVKLVPDFIAGYGSSVFYSFPKEKILGYIHRIKNEYYQTSLINLGILTPELIFDAQTGD